MASGRKITIEFLGKDTSASKTAIDVEKQFGKLGGTFDRIGQKSGQLLAGGLAAGGAAAVKLAGDAADLDAKMREVVTLFGETGAAADKSLGQIKTQVRSVSDEFGIAQETLTGGLYQAISAGVPKDNALEFMRVASMAATAGVTDVETAVDGITTTVNAFGLEAKDAQAVSDSMFAAVKGGKTTFAEMSDALFNIAPAAAASKVAFTEVNAAIATLTASGTPTSVATTQLRAALTGLQKPSEDLDKIFGDLGYKNAQAAIEAKGLGFALDAVKDASKGSNGRLQELLGSSEAVAAANVLAGTGAEKFATELKNQAGAAGATGAAFAEIAEGPAAKFDRLKVNLQNVGLELGTKLLPAMTKVTEAGLKMVTWIEDNQTTAGILAATLGGLLAVLTGVSLAMRAWTLATQLWSGVTKVAAAVQWLFNAAMSANPIGLVIIALAAMGAALFLLWKKSETFRAIVTGAFNAIKNAAGVAKDWIVEKFNAVVGFFANLPGRISKAASGMWDGIKDAFKSAVNWILLKWNNLSFTIGGGSILGMDIPSVTLGTPDIPYLAKGGVVTKPTLAMIGEAGPEAVVPLSKAGGMGSVTINFNGLVTDPLATAREIQRVLLQQKRTSGTALGLA